MTNLLIRDPFLAAPFRLMDELLRSTGNGNRVTGFTPPVDVHETEDEYLVKIDLPGVKSEDVNVEVNGHASSHQRSRAITIARSAAYRGQRDFALRAGTAFACSRGSGTTGLSDTSKLGVGARGTIGCDGAAGGAPAFSWARTRVAASFLSSPDARPTIIGLAGAAGAPPVGALNCA